MEPLSISIQLEDVSTVYTDTFSFIAELFLQMDTHKTAMDHLKQLKTAMDELLLTKEDIAYLKILVSENRNDWAKWEDTEYTAYKLMHQLIQKRLLLMVDFKPVFNFNATLSISSSSIIQFIDIESINHLKF